MLESKMFDHRNKKHIMTEPERTQIEIVAMIQQQQWLQQMRKKETQPSPSSIIGNNYLTLFTKVNYETGSGYLNDWNLLKQSVPIGNLKKWHTHRLFRCKNFIGAIFLTPQKEIHNLNNKNKLDLNLNIKSQHIFRLDSFSPQNKSGKTFAAVSIICVYAISLK